MINTKKLFSIVCVFAIVVSMFGAMTVSAATIPAATLNINYNAAESTTSQLVFDMTTDAEYLNSAAVVIDISPIWTNITGSNFTAKGNTINAASTMGPAVATNKSENAATAKFACLTTKKVKLQLAAPTTALPFDFVTAGSNVVAKLVIPLATPITEDVTLSIDAAATFLTPTVADDTTDTGYAVAGSGDYLAAGAMKINATSWTTSVCAPQVDERISVGVITDEDAAARTKTWHACVGADLVGANKVKAVLTNSAAAADDNTQEVALSFGDVDLNGEMQCEFDLIVKFMDFANAATTSLNIVKAN